MRIDELGNILGIWAHPDDETYLSAGVMALAVRAGNEVVCVSATRGELGSRDEARWPSAEIPSVRETELTAALAVLGVGPPRWLGYVDGRCSDVPDDAAVERIAGVIQEVEPGSILTFGPEGMTGHPDHRAVSRWVTAAFHRAARPGACLYYATKTPQWADQFVSGLNEHDVFAPGTPPLTPADEVAVALRLDPDLAELKLEALARHASQLHGFQTEFDHDFWKRANSDEYFRRAATR